MAGPVFKLLLLVMLCMALDCAEMTLRSFYRPSDIESCRELCRYSPDTFYFIQEIQACFRFSSNDSEDATNVSLRKDCMEEQNVKLATGCSFKRGVDVCKKARRQALSTPLRFLSIRESTTSVYDKNPPKTQTRLTTESVCAGYVKMSKYSCGKKLKAACSNGQVETVRKLVECWKCDIEGRGSTGRNPIMEAALHGHKGVFDLLVEKGCNLEGVQYRGNNILHAACRGGNTAIVQYILSHNVDSKDSRGRDGRTPVMVAAFHGHRDVLQLLAKKGCDLKVIDDNKNTLLHTSCLGGHLGVVKYLMILRGVEEMMKMKNKYGRTPVQEATRLYHKDIVDFLNSHFKDMNPVKPQTHLTTESECAGYLKIDKCDRKLRVACSDGKVEIVRKLIECGKCDVEARSSLGRKPIIMAAFYGHKDVFDLLVEKGCNLASVRDRRNTILHTACYGGNIDVVQYILSHNVVSIDKRGRDGRTPVMVAALHGHKDVLQLLVRKGCDLKVKDDKKNTLFHTPCWGGHLGVVKYLMTLRGVEEMMKMKNKYGRTPVQEAERLHHKDIVDFLNSHF